MADKQIVQMPLRDIIPYEGNPRKNDSAVDVVAKSILEFGFINPIVVDADNTIIAGHTRYKAAKKLKLTTAPVIKVVDLTPEQVTAYRIADNKTGEYAEWDFNRLQLEFEKLKQAGYSLDFTGYSYDELESLQAQFSGVELPDVPDEPGDAPEDTNELVKCPKCGFQFGAHP